MRVHHCVDAWSTPWRSLSVPSVSLLQHGILRDRELFTRLLTQLTVPVSDLFRDPGYFRALREHVLPLLATYPSTKVWVAGCSTGEEVYSLAILLEEAQLLERTLIYATDINPEALRTAESGRVHDGSRAGVHAQLPAGQWRSDAWPTTTRPRTATWSSTAGCDRG